jgi:O-6-methylguanine DNA methyltransferase
MKYQNFDSKFGNQFLLTTVGIIDDAVCWISFGENGEKEMRKKFKKEQFEEFSESFDLDIPHKIHLEGTDFQISVWEALLQIERGTTVSYSDVVKMIGKPSSVRAVASAIAANPISYLVPCHRVTHKNAKNTGNYRWGSTIKTTILSSEGVEFISNI